MSIWNPRNIWNDEDERLRPGNVLFWAVGTILVIFALTWGVVFLTFGLRVATAGLVGRGEAEIQTQSAQFRLTAYQNFFNDCASIQGLESSIDEQTAVLDNYKKGSYAYNTALSALVGTKAARHNAIAKYNQDALKWTIGQFRDEDLPYQIPDTNYPEDGGGTTCAVQ